MNDYQVWQYDTSSVFHFEGKAHPLPSPSLDMYKAVLTVPSDKHKYMDGIPALWTYGGYCYNRDSLSQWSICQPQNYYSWGVSFLQLFVFLIVTIIFAVLLYIAWMRTKLRQHSGEDAKKMFGRFRTAIEVSTALHQDFGQKTVDMSDYELGVKLRHQWHSS